MFYVLVKFHQFAIKKSVPVPCRKIQRNNTATLTWIQQLLKTDKWMNVGKAQLTPDAVKAFQCPIHSHGDQPDLLATVSFTSDLHESKKPPATFALVGSQSPPSPIEAASIHEILGAWDLRSSAHRGSPNGLVEMKICKSHAITGSFTTFQLSSTHRGHFERLGESKSMMIHDGQAS